MKIRQMAKTILAVLLSVALVAQVAAEEVIEDSEAEEQLPEVIAEDEGIVLGKEPRVVEGTEDLDALFENEDDVLENDEECSRISPKEVFYTELHPRLLNLLDEMSHFVESVLDRIESALEILLPHVQESPIGNIKVEEIFPEVRRFMFGMMRDVYDLIRAAWRDLIRAHVLAPNDSKGQLEALRVLRDAQKQGEEMLRAGLMELSITTKAIVLNSIHVIQDSLKLPKGTEEGEAAVRISQQLPKVAPNFLGTLMMKILEKGAEPDAYQKIQTNTLREITGPVDEMYKELEAVVEAGGEAEDLIKYWKKMVDECHLRLQKDPLFINNFDVIFKNEEYLTSLVLGLMASF